MKVNMPITNNEIELKETTTIVSTTDLKGIITSVNRDFIKISGYTEKELVGHSHNIVRHPDMPTAAFEDLWNTIKAGRPWTGLVKNRCKNGDHYWVEANVTPLSEAGHITGYMSVRNKPTREQIEQASTLYRQINDGKAPKISVLSRLNMFKNLSIKTLLYGIYGIVVIIVGALMLMLLSRLNEEIDFTRKEMTGVEYILAAQNVAVRIAQHRGLSTGWLAGNAALKEPLEGAHSKVDEAIRQLDEVDRRLGESLGSTPSWTGLKTKWQALSGNYRNLNSEENFQAHTALIGALLSFEVQVADSSNLSLDPEMASLYLMSTLVYHIPVLSEYLGRNRATGVAIITHGAASITERMRLAESFGIIHKVMGDLLEGMDKVYLQVPALKPKLDGAIQGGVQAEESFRRLVTDKLLAAEKPQVSATEFFDAATRTIAAVMKPYDAIALALNEQLSARVDRLTFYRLYSVASALLILSLIALALTYLIRRIVKSLDQAHGYFTRMASGDLGVRIEIDSQDEIAQILEAAKSMQIKLGFDMSEAMRISDENLRVKIALDSVSTNVMIADNDRNIIYMNKSVRDMLSNAESDLRKALPNFSVSRLMGGSIDDFHKNPQHQKQLLATFTSTYRTQIGIGGRTFVLTANPVLNEKGERLGAVVEWNDRTAELAAENDVSALVEAAISGELSSRIALEGKVGFTHDIAANINNMLDAITGPLNVAADYLKRIADGNIPPKITDEYQGDFNTIKRNLNTCIDVLNTLVSDADMLSQAAIEGRLETRADDSKHWGDFRKIVKGVNNTLDAVIGPLNVAAKYVDDISKGNIPAKITDSYNGDFNIIKNNLNTCIDAINALVADAGMLSRAAVEGKLATRADAAKHQGDYRKIVEGVNDTLDAVIGPLNVAAKYVDDISKGNIPPKITDSYNGDFNIIKSNLNTCIDAVNTLIADADMLSRAAVEGKLATRADAAKHQGDYRKIVEGVNDTLDAIIGPLNMASNYVEDISKGNIPAKITDSCNGDFNTIKNNLNTCIDAVNALVADAGMLSQAALEGRIQTRADASKHQGDFQRIVEGVNATLETIVTPIIVVKTAADSINTAAMEISAGNADLSHRTEQQAASLEETASSMEELASTVKQNADNARQANQMAVAASDVAVKGGNVVQQVVNTMSAINESARKIVDIISVIDGIALQTNILALNAAVEAARAGEQGRGFAVVASEVRNLAQRSAAAAKEIKALIGDSVEKVEDGSKLVGEAGKTMDEIVTSVRRVTDIMSEIAAASAEQSSGIGQVNQAITQMDVATQQNAALVEQAAAAAESLEEQAATLMQTVAQFRLDSDERAASLPAFAHKPATRLAAKAAKPGQQGDDEWSEF